MSGTETTPLTGSGESHTEAAAELAKPAAPETPLPPAEKMIITAKTLLIISACLFGVLIVCLTAAIYLKNDAAFSAISYSVVTDFTMMIGFWFGSSHGSQTKDAVIAGQLPPAKQGPNP